MPAHAVLAGTFERTAARAGSMPPAGFTTDDDIQEGITFESGCAEWRRIIRRSPSASCCAIRTASSAGFQACTRF